MRPPASSTVVRTVLRVAAGPRSSGARRVTVVAALAGLASVGRRLWVRRAARRFAAVRGPRFEAGTVTRLDVRTAPRARTPGTVPGGGSTADLATAPVVDATVVPDADAMVVRDDGGDVVDAIVVPPEDAVRDERGPTGASAANGESVAATDGDPLGPRPVPDAGPADDRGTGPDAGPGEGRRG